MAQTFKQLQDKALEWMADQNDTDLMRTLVKQSMDKAQRRLLTDEQFDFMLSPRIGTISVTASNKYYTLPEDYLQGLYFYDPDRQIYLEEIAPRGIMEAEDGLTYTDGVIDRFTINTIQGVLTQPTTSGTVVVTPSGGNEAAANGVVVIGLDANGNQVTEQLSSGVSWASLISSTSFSTITAVIKTGDTWTRTITITRGVTLLTLGTSEQVKQYQQFELQASPTQASTINYRYYRKPLPLVYDNQLPDIPEQFSDYLIYTALLDLQGFTRATPVEVKKWQEYVTHAETTMKATHRSTRTVGRRPRFQRFIERT